MRRLLLAAVTAFACVDGHAQACEQNFESTGNLLTGKTYKTWVQLTGVPTDAAFNRALAFTAENGFTIVSSNPAAGVISAAQSASYGKGKGVPLNVVVRPDSGGTRLSLTYSTPGGVHSPEDAIRRHFCLTAEAAHAAMSPSPASSTVAVAQPSAMPRGYATPTAAQQHMLAEALTTVTATQGIRLAVSDAATTINSFVTRVACLTSPAGASALNEFAAPGKRFEYYGSLAPSLRARYHDKGSCMTVARLQGWRAPANNALVFEAVYKADDSGEVISMSHELVKQPNDSWLFLR